MDGGLLEDEKSEVEFDTSFYNDWDAEINRFRRQESPDQEPETKEYFLTPLYAITGFFAFMMFIGPFLVKRGPLRGSFVDLATLAMHRRQELDERIRVFLDKCDLAIDGIENLKTQAKSFVDHLNCEPSELKDRFLNSMKKLDEYNYLITDFNLAVSKIDSNSTISTTPVQDISTSLMIPECVSYNLLDAISEPKPSTSKALEKQKRKRVPREDQLLITFSSNSCSSESVPITKSEKNIQSDIEENIKKISLDDSCSECNLPAQSILQVDNIYTAAIVHVDGISFWVITDNLTEVCDLMTEMTSYYKENLVELNLDQVMALTYCAYHDNEDNECFYRGLFIRLSEEDMCMAEVFLVDTGETRRVQASTLQPLLPQFANIPPYARCCHLAGSVSDELDNYEHVIEGILKKYIGKTCKIKVDDNTSESLGVYVIVKSERSSDHEILNDIILKESQALIDDKTSQGPVSKVDDFDEATFDITNCPEYEDPLEAVTGYHNRDEMDICKHYKGGADKTCFKGSRCRKRHVLKHPDGWTLDQVPVVAKFRPLPLPAPDTWLKVKVTHVAHFDRFYVHIVDEKQVTCPGPPSFGVVLPPRNLDELVIQMNSNAARMAYRKLTIVPAPGELVAALYLDDMWYRARVVSSTRADQNVEVMYIDYGNVVWVNEDAVRELEPRFWSLEAQACRCVLAGVRPTSSDSRQWAAARDYLTRLINERTLRAHVIARDYDEITVELFDDGERNISELMAAGGYVKLLHYDVIHDTSRTQIVVP
ncbi:unnamed protein product [Danaus chrysippus]|uniref:(African queen) hypothetical protein n=1 Tax=Danaus chrysippus TaxID=151541 RepID=A0A8J2R4I3_9NEOP|nr:unnamed protein product [Danaus chrysippus]